jgi:hypothetical protein
MPSESMRAAEVRNRFMYVAAFPWSSRDDSAAPAVGSADAVGTVPERTTRAASAGDHPASTSLRIAAIAATASLS